MAGSDEGYLAHVRFAQAVADLGARILESHALANARYGGHVDVSGEHPVWTDAPFTESSEVIAGLYLAECDEQTARKVAGMVPSDHVVEWRKVHSFT